MVIHLPTFFKEVENLKKNDVSYEKRLFVSSRAHIVFNHHQNIDGLREEELSKGGSAIGTTRRGIGPTYASKANRDGLRIGDLSNFNNFEIVFRRMVENEKKRFPTLEVDIEKELESYRDFANRLKDFVIDTIPFVNKAFKDNKKILIEGAQSTMLDIDFGTYPFVTSSPASVGGACTGLGISPNKIGRIIGVVKAFTTRVGAGPFPTELEDMQLAESIRSSGGEYGTTTGRPRRIGWLDITPLKYTHMINNYTDLNLTKIDVLSSLDEIKIGVSYMRDGIVVESFPDSLDELSQCTIVYETLKGKNPLKLCFI